MLAGATADKSIYDEVPHDNTITYVPANNNENNGDNNDDVEDISSAANTLGHG